MYSRHLLGKNRWLLPLILAFMLSGCGQKGALYLPDDNQSNSGPIRPEHCVIV